ncbi:hypothetical protein A2382_02325 [Candidatus Woesebacteria bacterium RIFOXYB1_FULL_38_16]|uniref:Uncharacterized protein n=1 Tax=Candidatus Woesebacteria bacterium RIFOXYB1_FULL_38_16 TaxID=1802538 RepID=A0A1F8CTG9_9BACT|nr:MAG: hypothetical protein A2191_04490 [Candidatus Woesebacteria bacterium RIFOXYA1_FULL_38_9]OGM78865.1 MAG: hypothetical protein A2382_02325 [Candidatus Woesebacteria bacterium RIFOXYB1_FULL_38_16]
MGFDKQFKRCYIFFENRKKSITSAVCLNNKLLKPFSRIAMLFLSDYLKGRLFTSTHKIISIRLVIRPLFCQGLLFLLVKDFLFFQL